MAADIFVSTGAELNAYLAKPSPPASQDQPCATTYHRLFILEDLPYNHTVTLGSHLHIPPGFFASHWNDPSAFAFSHRSPFQRCSLPNFRLHYAASNRVIINGSSNSGDSGIYAFDSRVSRHLVTYNKNGLVYDEAKSHHVLSFWSSPAREDGSWNAVILVDPPPGAQARCMATGNMYPLIRHVDEELIPKRFFFPDLLTPKCLLEDHTHWEAALSTPTYASMFDDTIAAFERSIPMATTYGPSSVVEIPRKLVISTMVAYFRRRYTNLVKLQNGSHFGPQTMQHNYLTSFSKGSCSTWSSEFFDFIVGRRTAMRICMRELEHNIVALGLDNPQTTAPHWEQDGWHSVKELGCMLEETLESISNGYLQYVTIQEARTSNSNAHSLSRITVLSMLFIPLSTLASIFSMGGDFLPGETRSWVFWVVALPVLAILVILPCHPQSRYTSEGTHPAFLQHKAEEITKTTLSR